MRHVPNVMHGKPLPCRTTFREPCMWKVIKTAILLVCFIVPGVSAQVPAPREPQEKMTWGLIETLSEALREVEIPYDPKRPYPDHLKFGKSWQEPKLCGPNSLYVLLRLMGRQVTHEEVLAEIPVGDNGCTLADLSQAATKFGLQHRVLQVSERDLRRLSPPFLVHEVVMTEGKPEEAAAGHFFVVTRFGSDGEVYHIDATSGAYQCAFGDRFTGSFSGYVLVPERTALGIPLRWAWYLLYAVGATFAVLAILVAVWSWRMRGVTESRIGKGTG